MPHRGFISGDGLDIHELAGEGDDVHAGLRISNTGKPKFE
jgi:hypothetical protein